MTLLSLLDYEREARHRLTEMAWGYYASGADDERALARNRSAWDDIDLHFRVLSGVADVDPSASVLGADLSFPVAVAPTAFQRLACEEGELATAAAASRAGVPMLLSTLSSTPMEAVCAAARVPVWFQLYIYRDRAITEAQLQRVEAAGCKAIVLTVDAPVLGQRERDVRTGFHLPDGIEASNLLPEGHGALPAVQGESGLAAYFARLLDPALGWHDIEWLRERTSLPIVLKGLVRPADAAQAVSLGVDGIVVSNHGGRQLDASPATATVLASVVDAVADARVRHRVSKPVPVLVDGGIRRGTDVVRALALGADAVLLGRPILWGLALDGRDGATHVLRLLREEVERAMALCGCSSVDEIGRWLVDPAV